MFEKLKETNEEIIKNLDDKELLKKYMLIREILNDSGCFFKMNVEQAYSILRDLKVEEKDLKYVYHQLLDYSKI